MKASLVCHHSNEMGGGHGSGELSRLVPNVLGFQRSYSLFVLKSIIIADAIVLRLLRDVLLLLLF